MFFHYVWFALFLGALILYGGEHGDKAMCLTCDSSLNGEDQKRLLMYDVC